MTKRAGLYLRISQDRSGEGLAVDRQRQDGTQLVTLRGWTLTGEYVDNDISAAGRKRRPGFVTLLNDIRDRHLDVVVAWALDRLVRSSRDRLQLIELCRATGTSIALVRGSDLDLTTAAGRLTAGMLGEIAQHEIDVKSERQRRAVLQAAEAGKPAGGQRPFGYRPGPDGPELHPDEAPVLADLYGRYLAGATCNELADWLNLRVQMPTTQGNRWSKKAVRVVLGNPRNAGLRGLRSTDPITQQRERWHQRTWPAKWPGVVSVQTWEAAVALLRATSRPGLSPGGHRYRHLLSGIAVCGLCGRHMVSGRAGGNAARIYTCTSNRHLSRRADVLDAFVRSALLDRLELPDAAGLLTPGPGCDVDALRGETLELRARLDGLATDYADGVLDREQARISGARLRSRLAEIDDTIGRAGAVDILAPLVAAVDVATVWEGYPLDRQRAVIARLMTVQVLRGKHGRPTAGAGFDAATVNITWLDPTTGLQTL